MEDYYPGSRKTRKKWEDENRPVPDESTEVNWADSLPKPKTYLLNSQPVEFYPLGAVATALNRKPVTVRKWETEGIIPRSPYIMPSHDPRGQRRLYTKQQIEALRRIAEEEGILSPSEGGKWKPIEQTQFRKKALTAFREQ